MNLEPCPFCAHARACSYFNDDFRSWTVQCGNCPVDIGWYSTEAEAVAAWNRRPTLAAAVQAEREAILSRLESLKVGALAHEMPDAFGLGVACGVVKGRGTVTPSPSPAVDVLGVVERFISAVDEAGVDLASQSPVWNELRALVAPRKETT